MARTPRTEVALVHLMLKLVKSRAGTPYYSSPYTNGAGADTAAAIKSFQVERGIKLDASSRERAGLISPSGQTWLALVAGVGSVGDQYRNVRSAPGLTTVYLAMPAPSLAEAVNSSNIEKLQSAFKVNVIELINRYYAATGITWSLVPRTGGFRPFAGQEGLTTDAGYGESVHQFGLAVDLTVKGFTWFDTSGRLQTSAISFSGMNERLKHEFFTTRNAIATNLHLYPTIKSGDLFHIQAHDDATLDSVSSLMSLLHRVGPRKMKWKPRYMTPTEYLCDLGLGGDTYYVGTANDIWNLSASHRISKDDLVSAVQAKKKVDPKFSLGAFIGQPKSNESATAGANIGESERQAVQRLLKAEFEAAATHWREWKPVTYPSGERRPKNPNKRK